MPNLALQQFVQFSQPSSETALSTKFQKLLAERNAALARKEEPEPQENTPERDFSQFADLIPEADDSPTIERLQERVAIDQIIDGISIVQAYEMFINKMKPKVGNRKESIMISCPLPWHPDRNPSAWLNSEKNTWYCAACEKGGDVYDLAAIKFGYDLETYKTNSFVELRKEIITFLGYGVYEALGETPVVYKEAPTVPRNFVEKVTADPLPATEDLEARYEEKLEEAIEKQLSQDQYSLNWQELMVPNTFLSEYMNACTQDFNTEEYHFWHGMIAIAMACGRNVFANDTPKIYPNIFVCLMGGSGSGKSKSRYHLDQLLSRVLPFDYALDRPEGVKDIPTPGSAEYLIQKFSHPIYDINPHTGKQMIVDYAPIKGVIKFEELSSFAVIARRSGSDLGTRMLEFYDCKRVISTGSRMAGDTIAMEPFACALTTTQPRSLSRILSQADEDSGFLNRWLFVGGKPKKGKFWGEVQIDLKKAELKLLQIHAWANKVQTVTLSPEAEKQANKDLHSFILKDKDQYDPALGRIDLTIKKLCLLFAINEMSNVITLEIYQRAMKMYNYIKSYAVFRSEFLTAETEQSKSDSIVVIKIKEFYDLTGNWPTARELLRTIGSRRIQGAQALSKTLDSLIKIGIVETQTLKPQVGRPTTRYAISS